MPQACAGCGQVTEYIALATGDNGMDIAGGASTVRQALIADVINELTLDIAPVLLGSGERIFDGLNPSASNPPRCFTHR